MFHILELCKKFMHDLMEQTMLVYNQREEFSQMNEILTKNTRLENTKHTEVSNAPNILSSLFFSDLIKKKNAL